MLRLPAASLIQPKWDPVHFIAIRVSDHCRYRVLSDDATRMSVIYIETASCNSIVEQGLEGAGSTRH